MIPALHSGTRRGFSLVETVIALGIFVFCIVGIVGLMPVGLNAVRGVSNENNAIHIASSIQGIWEVASANSTLSHAQFPVTNFYIGATNNAPPFYFNEFGEQTNQSGASLRMTYNATVNSAFPSAYDVRMVFAWPPVGNATSTREFTYTISK
jgi:uncharacterized protein (TIGR02598 family)